jgi:hypothetical protein
MKFGTGSLRSKILDDLILRRACKFNIVTRLRVGRPGFYSQQGLGFFLLATTTRPAVGTTKPPIRGYRWFFSLGQSSRGVKLTAHLHLVPSLRMCGAISSLLDTSSRRGVYWNRVLLEKLIIGHIIKKFSDFYGTRKFITLSTRFRHWTPTRCI